tara:strand:- start:600 stop:2225 length:1626 start_codon:yes stop_codon:yes gene_type:complete
MKKITLLILFVLPFFGMAQLTTNNTFTIDDDGGATGIEGWSLKNGGTLSHDATEGNVSAGSLKLVSDGDSRAQTSNTTVPIAGSYTLTGYVKGNIGDSYHVQIWQSGGGGVGASGTTKTILTSGWEPFSITADMVTGQSANIRFWGDTSGASPIGDYYLDDVYLSFNTPGDFNYDFTFDTDTEFEGWGYSNGTATVVSGSLNLVSTGNSPKIILDPLYYKVPADTYTTVAITLTNETTNTLLRFYHPKVASGTLYTEIYIAPNAAEQTYTLNLTDNDGWSGAIDELGILIRSGGNGNPAAGTIKFSRVQFSSGTTEKHVYNFDGTTTEGWEMVSANGYVSDLSSGLLTFIPTNGKFAKITMGANHINTAIVNAIRVVLENNSTTDNQIRIVLPNSGGNISQGVLLAPVAEATYEIALDGLSGWTGNVSQISLQFVDSGNNGKSSGGGEFIINKIEFFANETIGVDKLNADLNLVLFPNPVNNLLSISTEVTQIEIYNILGQKIVSLNNVTSIDTSNFERGSYIAIITSDEGATATKRFVKN